MQIANMIKKYKDLLLAILFILNLIAWGIDRLGGLGGRFVTAENIVYESGPPGTLAPGLRIGYERKEFKVGGLYVLKYMGKQADGSHLFAIGL